MHVGIKISLLHPILPEPLAIASAQQAKDVTKCPMPNIVRNTNISWIRETYNPQLAKPHANYKTSALRNMKSNDFSLYGILN